MNIRTPLSKKLRFDVFKRDSFKCQYCGNHPPGFILHVDHIHPVKLGGKNNMDNLITSCSVCNLGKAANPLTEIPQSLLDKAEIIAEKELQLKGYYKLLENVRDRIDNESWKICELFQPNSGDEGFSIAKRRSIKVFIEKIGFHEVYEAMEIALSKSCRSNDKTFSYFCGICWNKVKELNNG